MKLLQLGTVPPAYFDGILMRANPRLHHEAFEVLASYLRPGAKIIDVGSGQGAFAARLHKAGYEVTAVDKNVDDFKATGVDFIPVDFDRPDQVAEFTAANLGKYDIAIGMEVIEHVENPWEYCRFLLSLVKSDGFVFLTTPNTESAHSRANFFIHGMLDHFSMDDYRQSGHINPVTAQELQIIASSLDAKVLVTQALCALPWLILSKRVSTVFGTFLSMMFRPFMGASASGDILSVMLQKTR